MFKLFVIASSSFKFKSYLHFYWFEYGDGVFEVSPVDVTDWLLLDFEVQPAITVGEWTAC